MLVFRSSPATHALLAHGSELGGRRNGVGRVAGVGLREQLHGVHQACIVACYEHSGRRAPRLGQIRGAWGCEQRRPHRWRRHGTEGDLVCRAVLKPALCRVVLFAVLPALAGVVCGGVAARLLAAIGGRAALQAEAAAPAVGCVQRVVDQQLEHVQEHTEEDGRQDDEDIGAYGTPLLGSVLPEKGVGLHAEGCLQGATAGQGESIGASAGSVSATRLVYGGGIYSHFC